MNSLSELQYDALIEMFNISIGRAAKAMSNIASEEIHMSVPKLHLVSIDEAATRLNGMIDRRICCVAQHFNGAFEADGLLMFPENRSLEIVRMMLGESYSLDELSDLEQEAMSEVGNIILNACVGSFADMTGTRFDSTLPEVRIGAAQHILRVAQRSEDETILLIHINFIIAAKEIHGYMAFLMDVPSTQGLLESIDRFLGAATATAAAA